MLSTYKSIPNNLRRIYTNDINLFFLKCMWNLIELRKEFFNRFTWHRKNACDLYYKLECYILFHQWGVYSSTKITSKSRSLIRDKIVHPRTLLIIKICTTYIMHLDFRKWVGMENISAMSYDPFLSQIWWKFQNKIFRMYTMNK